MKYFICIFLFFLCWEGEGFAQTIHLEEKTYEQSFELQSGDRLIGEKGTVVNGGILIDGQDIKIENLKVNGANVKNKGIIFVRDSKDVMIKNVEVYNNTESNGIHIDQSQLVEVVDSNINNVKDGIYVEHVQNIILKNIASKNNRYGIHFMYTSNGQLTDSHIDNNITGIMLMVSDHINLIRNIVADQLLVNGTAVTLYHSSDIHVKQNIIKENQLGISIQEIKNSHIENNELLSNLNAIEMYKSDIPVKSNKFINNINIANSDKKQKQFIKNYYDDLEIFDLNDDGIGDKPYRYTNIFNQMMVKDSTLNFYQNSPVHILLKWIENRSGADEEGQKDMQPGVEKR